MPPLIVRSQAKARVAELGASLKEVVGAATEERERAQGLEAALQDTTGKLALAEGALLQLRKVRRGTEHWREPTAVRAGQWVRTWVVVQWPMSDALPRRTAGVVGPHMPRALCACEGGEGDDPGATPGRAGAGPGAGPAGRPRRQPGAGRGGGGSARRVA